MNEKKNNTIHFVKMHGVGNDYIFVDTSRYQIPDPSAAAIEWSDRHKGIGSDGLVLIGRPDASQDADFTMRIFNADGSEGLMCGNATRCIGKYAYEHGLTDKTRIRLLTASGVKELNLTVEQGIVTHVKVDMSAPALSCEDQFCPDQATLPDGVFVSMGNPHYVVFVDNIDDIDIAVTGSKLERHQCFPQRCNIEFAQVRSDGIRMRVWERGSGITMACGTGACATAVAAAVSGRCGRQSCVIMDGGTLQVIWSQEDNHVYLDGPACIVFEGEVDLPQ